MRTNQHLFFKYSIIILICLSLFACSPVKQTSKRTNSNAISFKRIKADIAKLDEEEFEVSTILTEEFKNVSSEDKLIDHLIVLSRVQFDNRCLVYVVNRISISLYPIPLEEDKYSTLLLLYSKNKTDWKLDTVLTTYPDFDPIEEFFGYFMAGTQRCIEGRCQWYNAVQKITTDNRLETVFKYENFDRTMYLEDLLLSEYRELVLREIGEEVQNGTEILEYVWNGQELQEILIKETTGILTGVENDFLIVKTDSLFRTINIKTP